MTKEVYESILKFPKLLKKNKYKIMNLLIKEKRAMNISEIQRKVKISYKEVRRHILQLETYGLVHIDKLKQIHHPSLVSLRKFKKN